MVGRKLSPSTAWGTLIGSGGIICSHPLLGIIFIYKKNAPNNPGAFMGFFPVFYGSFGRLACRLFQISCKSPSESQKEKPYEK